MKSRLETFSLAIVTIVTLLATNASAGQIQIVTTVETKSAIVIPPSGMITTLQPSLVACRCLTTGELTVGILPNLETFRVSQAPGTAIVPVNVYQQLIVTADSPGEGPQSVSGEPMVDFFWFVAADTGAGLGSLPPGFFLDQALLFGASGTAYEAEITLIHDLADLPVFSMNDLQIVWDISAFSETTGNFFLARATLPEREICVPEPTAMLLLGTGLAGVAIKTRKRLKSRKRRQGS